MTQSPKPATAPTIKRSRGTIHGYAIQTSTSRPAVKDRTPLVEDFLYSTDTMFMYAPSGGYKSMVAIHLAVAVASGGTFMGKQAHQARVLYVDGELSQYTFDQRLALFGDSDELDILSECYQNPDDLWQLPPIHIEKTEAAQMQTKGRRQKIGERDREEGDASQKDWPSALLTTVRENGYKLVIFDNVRTLTDGINENDSAAITPLNNLVKRLRHNGCAVLVVHHTRKGGGEDETPVYSGSTNFLTVYNSCLGIEKVGTQGIRFHIEKEREQSVGDYFREGCWRIGDQPGQGFVPFDGTAAGIIEGYSLIADIESGQFRNRAEVYAAAKKRGIKINTAAGRTKDLFAKLVDRGAIDDDEKQFETLLATGLAKGLAATQELANNPLRQVAVADKEDF